MMKMKCKNCGFENKKGAKFCAKCGSSLSYVAVNDAPKESNTSKYIIIALIAIICILILALGYFTLIGNSNSSEAPQNDVSQSAESVENAESNDDVQTQSISSSQSSTSSIASESKSWELIGSYSGSGSGTETIRVPEGQIMVKLSAYPIKNYATNHLYVSGSNGVSGGVDWGSTSAVKTRSDSFSYTSSSSEVFDIDYYETVSWEVDFYRYQ